MIPDNLAADLEDVAQWTAGELAELRAMDETQLQRPVSLTNADLLAIVGSLDTMARMALGMVAAAGQLANHPILGRLLG